MARFFLVAFIWSWTLWLPLVFAPLLGIAPETVSALFIPLTVLAAFGPGAGALASVGRAGAWRHLRRFVDLRIGVRAFIVPVLVLGSLTAIAWLTPALFGEPVLPMLLPSAWVFPPYLVAMVLFGGGQEELGWRGYALERMEARFGMWTGNVLLGAIWALWHLPLWFIPGATQRFMSVPGFVILCIGFSFFFSWVYEAAGRKPFAALWAHGLANAFVPLMPVMRMEPDVPKPGFWIWAALHLLSGIVFMWARLRRKPCREAKA